MHNYATPFAHIILLGASPEVDAACVAGDVEHSQALQTRQGHGNAVTLRRRRKAQDVRGKTAESILIPNTRDSTAFECLTSS